MNPLTAQIKDKCRELGADLVGIAGVDRWANAPVEHSPQGVMPGARTVVVCGIHFLDAPTELGQEADVRVPGPALSEMDASSSLEYLAYRLAKYLQGRGIAAIPIRQSGIWSYRPRPGADRGWIGDICSYYAAACAGLGEIGWNNLCITPEFGPRVRLVSILTDADLDPDPLYDGEPLCDRCMLCAQNCPTECFDREVKGMLQVRIEDKTFEFPNRNLWRCAIGENFQLDVCRHWPEPVTEESITQQVRLAANEHPEWIHGWKMGMCLKYCVPPQRRYFDSDYSKSPRRRRDERPDETPQGGQRALDALVDEARKLEIQYLAGAPAEVFSRAGIDLQAELPDARSAIVFGITFPQGCSLSSSREGRVDQLRLGRMIQRHGYSVIPHSTIDAAQAAALCGLPSFPDEKGSGVEWRLLLTAMPWPQEAASVALTPEPAIPPVGDLTGTVKTLAREAGADLVGIASAERVKKLREALDAVYSGQDHYEVVDKGWPLKGLRNIWGGQAMPYNPEARQRDLTPKSLDDYLPGARSVIVVGVEHIHASVDDVGVEPGLKAGHYGAGVHGEALATLDHIMLRVARKLAEAGYRAVPTKDLFGLASRSYIGAPALTAGRFEAVAAGLGEIGESGLLLTPKYGARQRVSALITDAPLAQDALYADEDICRHCGNCARTCMVGALSGDGTVSVELEGKTLTWRAIDQVRCDCGCRYGLAPDCGVQLTGNTNAFELPEQITPEFICEAMRQADCIQRPGYATAVERCMTSCPAHLPRGG